MKSSNKRELWCFVYQYTIWLSRLTDNRLHGDVDYFLWNGSRPSYKHIKIWGLILYSINGYVTRYNLDDRSNHSYFIVYVDTA